MSYFVMYRFENENGDLMSDYYDSFIYEGKLETQKDFNELKKFIKSKRGKKGRLFIIRITELTKKEASLCLEK